MNDEKTTRDGAAKPLRLLVVEDSPQDTEIAVREIQRGGFDVTWKRVDTAGTMRAALDAEPWDVVVSDYSMPNFDGLAALRVWQEKGLDIPFIIVSVKIGEETAVAAMKAGAHDYIMKDRLARLAPAIERELREAKERHGRKRAEEALKASEERFRLAGESATDLIYEWDLKERVDWFGKIDELLGYARSEFPSTFEAWANSVHPNDRNRVKASVKNHLEKNEPYDIEYRIRKKDGTYNYWWARGTAVLDEKGNPSRWIGAVTDVTERKAAQDALLAKNEELKAITQQLWQAAKLATMGELASSIAHELNNPLATVSLRVESLIAKTTGDDPRRRELEIIGQEVERMGNLVRNLLQFSHRSQQQISTVNVCDEIEKTLELVHYHLRKNNVAVAREFKPEGPLIHADRQQLRQLFLNLFTNAGDAMPEGGTLTIRVAAQPEGKKIFIEIADTGIGIPPEILPKVMEHFYTTKSEGKGTGLGLAICQRIAQEHQGTFDIVSEGIPGKGTKVRITLSSMDTGNSIGLTDP